MTKDTTYQGMRLQNVAKNSGSLSAVYDFGSIVGGKAQQVAGLRATQVGVVDQERGSDAVQAVLEGHHLSQFFARRGHLGGDGWQVFVDGARHDWLAGAVVGAHRVGGAGGEQAGCRHADGLL